MSGIAKLGSVFEKLMRSGRRSSEKLCMLEIGDRLCLGKLLYQGLLRDIVLGEDVCGIEVDIAKQPLGPALRRLRADALSLEVMLEKRYDVIRSEELELLKKLEKRIAKEGSPVRVVVRLKLCGNGGSAREELEAYGCNVKGRCTDFDKSFF